MKLWTLALGSLLGTGLTGFAQADAQAGQKKPDTQTDQPDVETPGPWMGRIRLMDVVPENHSAPFSSFQGYAVHVSTKVLFEGDVSYFFTKAFALELGANVPTQQGVNVVGFGSIGTITLVVPTLTAQYHFEVPHSPVLPYVGLGVAYTHAQAQNLNGGGSPLAITRDTYGYVFQLGLDIAVAQGFYANLDFKHYQSIPNLKDSSGNPLTDMNMSPNVFSVGVGYRF